MKKVVLYEWPESQKCMDCEHGEFVAFIENSRGSDYICHIGCTENDGVECPRFKMSKECLKMNSVSETPDINKKN